jgi:tetratricopeptide (TPR) repeat protein
MLEEILKKLKFILIPLMTIVFILNISAQRHKSPDENLCDMTIQKQARSLIAEGKLDEALSAFQAMLNKDEKEIWTTQAILVCGESDIDARTRSLEEATKAPVIVIKRVIDSKVCFRVCAGVFRDKTRATELARALPSPFKEAKPYPLLLVYNGIFAKGAFDLAQPAEQAAPAMPERITAAAAEEKPLSSPDSPAETQKSGETADYGESFFLKGLEAYNQNDFDNAEIFFRQSIASRPERFEAYNNLGAILLQKKKYEDAKDILEKAVAIQPGYPNTRSNLAGAYWFLGRRADAISEAQRAFRLDSHNVRYCTNLASFLFEEKRYSDAKIYLNVVKIIDPTNKEALDIEKKIAEAEGGSPVTNAEERAPESVETQQNGKEQQQPSDDNGSADKDNSSGGVKEKDKVNKEHVEDPDEGASPGGTQKHHKGFWHIFRKRANDNAKSDVPADDDAKKSPGE